MINRHVATIAVMDPGQDSAIPIFRVPSDHVYTIERVFAQADRTLAAGTTNYFSVQLLNGGTAGTGTTAIASAIGGTVGWTANTPQEGTVTDGSGDLTEGQWLVAKYDETGSVTPGVVSVTVEYLDGIGANAEA